MIFDLATAMDIPGWTNPEDLEWLHQQAQRFERVVEIGTWLGRSATALSMGCPGQVWTVDTFQGSPSEASNHAEAQERDLFTEASEYLSIFPRTTILRMTSLEASRVIDWTDMVFLDGEHTRESVLIDLITWVPKCRSLVCGHDVDWEGVLAALAIYGIPFQRGPGTIWYMEKV